jgi:hypothetical protein
MYLVTQHSPPRRPWLHIASWSVIGGIAETQEMLNFCGEHGVTSDIEVIKIQDINKAYERMMKSDVKYRFVIDMASLKDSNAESKEGRK